MSAVKTKSMMKRKSQATRSFEKGLSMRVPKDVEPVENNVAGDSSGVNQKERVERGAMEVVAMGALGVPPHEGACEPRESSRENRQADERMSEAAMIARDT